jgi:hypothetical protein
MWKKYIYFFVYTNVLISIPFAADALSKDTEVRDASQTGSSEPESTRLAGESVVSKSSLSVSSSDDKPSDIATESTPPKVAFKILIYPPCLKDNPFVIYYATTEESKEILKKRISGVIPIQVKKGRVSHFYLQPDALAAIMDPHKKDAILMYIGAYISGFMSDSQIVRDGAMLSFID